MRITSRRSRSAAGFAALLALALTMAGCAAAPAGSGGAPPASGTDSPDAAAEFTAARDAYDLKLAQCLRDAGFQVADPKPGQGITETGDDLNAAASVCMAELGDPPQFAGRIDPTEALKEMLTWADCLRDRGVEVEEPRLAEAFVVPADATEQDIDACIPA